MRAEGVIELSIKNFISTYSMGSEETCNWYEELRKKNMQHNEMVMRMLGLSTPR